MLSKFNIKEVEFGGKGDLSTCEWVNDRGVGRQSADSDEILPGGR